MSAIAEWFDLALRHYQSGALRQAEALCRQVLQVDSAHADAHHLLGVLAHQTGQQETAMALIGQAIALNPSAAVFHYHLSIMLKEQGQLVDAALYCRQALRLNPHFVDALTHLGLMLLEQGQAADAAMYFRQALSINPDDAEIHNNLGVALKHEGQLAEAVRCYRQALRLNPQSVNALNNLAIALRNEGQLPEAVECWRQALRVHPAFATALNNLGVALKDLGQLDEATASHEQALRLKQDEASARWNLALLRLLKGEFHSGWPDYELRWAQRHIAPPTFDQPRWNGAPLDGKTLLVYAEQGLGDTIQFVRYLPLVQKLGCKVLFECQPALLPLLEGVAGVDQLVGGSPLPPFDVHAPLLSLPGILGTTLATIPADIPYLRAKSKLVEHWRNELGPHHGLSVGIAWQGSAAYQGDRLRSIPVAHFEALTRVGGVRLVSLQKGPSDPLRSLPFPILDLSDRLDTAGAFLDTAAAMMNVDLVVTADTAVAHLAGAMGVPAWVVLPFAPDWRWQLERSDSPWYPTLRLFRQSRFADWTEVFEDVAAALRAHGERVNHKER